MTPQVKEDPAQAPGRPEAGRPETAPSRLRAWVIGLLLIPLLVFWVEYTECIASGPDMAGMSLPMAVVFGLLVVIPVNLLVKRFAPRAALTQADLLMIYSMNTVAVYICGIGMMQFLNAPLVGWKHFATNGNKVRCPRTNGFVERFHRTVLDEFFRRAFRTKLYLTVAELQVDLDAWLVYYNTERPPSGSASAAPGLPEHGQKAPGHGAGVPGPPRLAGALPDARQTRNRQSRRLRIHVSSSGPITVVDGGYGLITGGISTPVNLGGSSPTARPSRSTATVGWQPEPGSGWAAGAGYSGTTGVNAINFINNIINADGHG